MEEIRITQKMSKTAANYGISPAPWIHSCGICDHFLLGGACEIVAGDIEARKGCKFFTPELKFDPGE